MTSPSITLTSFSGGTRDHQSERQGQREQLQTWAQRSLIVGLLAGVFLLAIPHLALAALACCGLLFVGYAVRCPIHWVCLAVVCNFGFWLFSGLASGGLVLDFLSSREFWRGEGRCFLFYLPLLALPFFKLDRGTLRFVVQFVCILTAMALVLAMLWLLGYGALFQAHLEEGSDELNPGNYFVGFQTSHTGAGAFWGTVAAFLSAYSLRTKQRVVQAFAISAVLLTLATGCRAATLGLIGVFCWLLVRGELLSARNWAKAVPIAGCVALGGLFVFTSAPEIGERMSEVFEESTMKAISAAAEHPTLQNAAGHFHSGSHLENHNLVIRVFLWKYAMRLFRESPLLGIGFGRFNDTDLQFSGIPGVLQLAVEGERYAGCGIRWDDRQRMTSVGNAHNSYFHGLAETGIIGLGMTLALWWLMFLYCGPRADERATEALAFSAGCRSAILCLMVMALFGHALAAPSGGIPLTTLVGTWIAYRHADR